MFYYKQIEIMLKKTFQKKYLKIFVNKLIYIVHK